MSSASRIITLASLDTKQAFGAYASTDLKKWRELIGQCILHQVYDVGMIIDVQRSPRFNEDCLYIEFVSETRHFKIAKFSADPYVLELTLSPETTEHIQNELLTARGEQMERLEARRAELDREEHARQAVLRAEEEQRIAYERRVEQLPRERREDLQRLCQERRIRALMHFTRLDNLSSILTHGLLPRDTLESGQFPQAVFNDHERLDNCRDALCLSIGFPNYKMFYPLHKDSPYDWVVLEIDPCVLWEKDCAFCVENAAAEAVRSVPITTRKTAAAFARLFDDYHGDNQYSRRDSLCIPDGFPTHPQSEVLVFGPIEPSHIRAIHFKDFKALQKTRSRLGDKSALYGMGTKPDYFKGRRDHAYWGVYSG